MTFGDFKFLPSGRRVRMSDFIDDVMLDFARSTDYEPTQYRGVNSPIDKFDPPIIGAKNVSGVLVCVESLHKEAEIVLEYWAGKTIDGKWSWSESVAQIARRHGMKVSDLVDLVMDSDTRAFDLRARCQKSGFPKLLRSRGDFRNRSSLRCLCERCAWDEYSKLPHVAKALERGRATALFFDVLFGIFPASAAVSYDGRTAAQIRRTRSGA
jgi:hypothetical protein